MALETQIELISNPGEFVRLCNAILVAEHGLDFLPIDDDRPDGGNDGFLQSENRMYAMHCFKRRQNAGLDDLIRSKMRGDLLKAVRLRDSGAWPVEKWTFVSNYPMFGETGRAIRRLGVENELSVDWMGPELLAQLFQKHAGLHDRFPQLLVARITERLDEVLCRLRDGESRSPEIDRLLRELPDGWRFALYAHTLALAQERLSYKRRNFELGVPDTQLVTTLDADQAYRYLRDCMAVARTSVVGLQRLLAPSSVAAAFGDARRPASAEAILHLADGVARGYERLLDCVAEMRAATVPTSVRHALAVASEVLVDLTEQLGDHLSDAIQTGASATDDAPPQWHIALRVDPATWRELQDAIARARSR